MKRWKFKFTLFSRSLSYRTSSFFFTSSNFRFNGNCWVACWHRLASKSNVSCIIWCSLGNGPLTTGGGGGGGVGAMRADASCDWETGWWRKSDVAVVGGNTAAVDWFAVVGLKWNVDLGGSLTIGRNGVFVGAKPSVGG
jgi:hypothetical protein